MRFALAAFAILVMVLAVALAGCDDPYIPHAPYYEYKVTVTGLENFTTENGTAMVYLPIPAVDGEPILKEGWWPNYPLRYGEERHGTRWIRTANTSYGPMLALEINMTDYYYSYAGATPIAISPGQNMSEVPTVVPDRIDKNLSFDDVSTIASGSISMLDYPTSAVGRENIINFLDQPLLPATAVADGNYTSYIYLDEGLRPIHNDSTINLTATLRVSLNHNKVNASEEGARRFEVHYFTVNGSIPGNATGFIPVQVWHSYESKIYYL
jgi:hypothetical protein